ncbi:hypothetical protein KY359_05665 [Candidatus Woesearchaeota archaeon]|nr:hypothetical protein [Candidatus Woesearchaeota archaeon]
MQECPNCGNRKHQDIVRIEIEGQESRTFKCKSCGHIEYEMPPVDEQKDQEAVERMGDAFREYLKSRQSK